jgi:hypothetical protein
MNRKQLLILLAIVVVLGAAGWIILRNNSNSWHAGGADIGGKLLPGLPVNDIAQVTIKSGDGEVTLARDNNLWRVRERGNYPANFGQISQMLMKFADLKVVQNETFGPSQLGRFQLLPPGPGPDTATAVDFQDQAGKSLGSLLLGKKHLKAAAPNAQMGDMGDDSWPDGRYVMAGAGAREVALISDPLEDVQTKPDQWVSKDFLTVEKPRAIAVQFPVATNSWKLTRASETNDWQLADARPGEKLDASKISGVTSPLSSASFNDVAAPSAAATNGTGGTVLTVDTFDGFTYVSHIGPKYGDDYPVRFAITASLPVRTPAKDETPADKARLDKEFAAQQQVLADKLARESALTNWIYQMPAFSLEEILKTRQQLLVEADTNTPSAPQTPAEPQISSPSH